MNIYYLSDQEKTVEVCMEYVRRDPHALLFVPKASRTKELLEVAVSINGLVIEYVTGDQQTKRLRQIAIKQNPDAIQFIDKKS